jgi:hypothetical protein
VRPLRRIDTPRYAKSLPASASARQAAALSQRVPEFVAPTMNFATVAGSVVRADSAARPAMRTAS